MDNNFQLINSVKMDNDLTKIANAFRQKNKINQKLKFPEDFIEQSKSSVNTDMDIENKNFTLNTLINQWYKKYDEEEWPYFSKSNVLIYSTNAKHLVTDERDLMEIQNCLNLETIKGKNLVSLRNITSCPNLKLIDAPNVDFASGFHGTNIKILYLPKLENSDYNSGWTSFISYNKNLETVIIPYGYIINERRAFKHNDNLKHLILFKKDEQQKIHGDFSVSEIFCEDGSSLPTNLKIYVPKQYLNDYLEASNNFSRFTAIEDSEECLNILREQGVDY